MARLNRSHGETQAPGILCVVHRSSSVAFLCVFVCIIGSPIHFNCSCSNPNRRHNRRLLSRTTKTRYWIRFQRQQWRKTRQGELTLLESDLGNECRLKMVISCGTPSHRLLRPPPPPCNCVAYMVMHASAETSVIYRSAAYTSVVRRILCRFLLMRSTHLTSWQIFAETATCRTALSCSE